MMSVLARRVLQIHIIMRGMLVCVSGISDDVLARLVMRAVSG